MAMYWQQERHALAGEGDGDLLQLLGRRGVTGEPAKRQRNGG